MKKIIFSGALLIFIIITSHAQIKNDVKIKQAPVKIVKAQIAPVYSLSSVRVNIRTGADNKEFPSAVYLTLWIKGHQQADYVKDCLYNIRDLKNEMKINSNTEMGLEKYAGSPDKFTLEALQRTGVTLSIGYLPNFFMDAWKIEGVTLTMEFRDQDGNLHPTLGTRVITFNNAYGFLNNEYHSMHCSTDGNLNALTASIEKF